MLNKEFCLRVFNVVNDEIASVIYDNMPDEKEIEGLIKEKNGFSVNVETRYYIVK